MGSEKGETKSPKAQCIFRGDRARIFNARKERERGASSMKKGSNRKVDELRPEYDLSKLKGGVRGKYYRQAIAGTNLVLIEPELAHVFSDTESVNRAPRLLMDTAKATVRTSRRTAKKRSTRNAGKPAA